jgi:hypothetical protein
MLRTWPQRVRACCVFDLAKAILLKCDVIAAAPAWDLRSIWPGGVSLGGMKSGAEQGDLRT